jgi:Tfp pilus assembly protein PilX
MSKKGITLIEVIMIIVLLGIITGGITSYIGEGLRLNASNLNNTKALYMAQAGLMSGLADYIADGLISPQSNVLVTGEFRYSVGGSSSLIAIDGTNVKANGRVVNTWPLTNISSATAVTVNSIVVEWDFVANLNSMKIGNSYIFKNGSLTSPATIDSSNDYNNAMPLTIPANTTYGGTNTQYIQFSVNVPAYLTVSVTFNLSDGSSLKKYLVIGGNATNNEFSLRATGIIQGGAAGTARRSLVATYDIGTGKITSWQESSRHIIP